MPITRDLWMLYCNQWPLATLSITGIFHWKIRFNVLKFSIKAQSAIAPPMYYVGEISTCHFYVVCRIYFPGWHITIRCPPSVSVFQSVCTSVCLSTIVKCERRNRLVTSGVWFQETLKNTTGQLRYVSLTAFSEMMYKSVLADSQIRMRFWNICPVR